MSVYYGIRTRPNKRFHVLTKLNSLTRQVVNETEWLWDSDFKASNSHGKCNYTCNGTLYVTSKMPVVVALIQIAKFVDMGSVYKCTIDKTKASTLPGKCRGKKSLSTTAMNAIHLPTSPLHHDVRCLINKELLIY